MAALTPEAFRSELARIGEGRFDAETPFALAVSGGSDSLALMALAAEALDRPALVLSVDHGLREGAAAECRHVAELAGTLGMPHQILNLHLPPGGDIQARARQARYAAMGEECRAQGIPALLTAHHADDQAETLLMRLARGSGLAGLSGVRSRQTIDGVKVLRPLLPWRRHDLSAIVTARGWSAANDPSNQDPRFDRTRARRLLSGTGWLSADRLAASAAHLAEAEAALAWAAKRAFDTRSQWQPPALLLDPSALPAELRRRLLQDGVAAFGHTADGPSLARLLARLDAGGSGTLGPVRAQARKGQWRLTPAPPRRQR